MDGDVAGGGGDCTEDGPDLWKDISLSSCGIVLTHLAMVAGLLLWREASAKVFILLGSGGWGQGQFIINVCADDS